MFMAEPPTLGRLEEAYAELMHNVDQPMTIDQMAYKCGVSVSYFCKLQTGVNQLPWSHKVVTLPIAARKMHVMTRNAEVIASHVAWQAGTHNRTRKATLLAMIEGLPDDD